jgi:tetratricopeptide (TPR) repeat protein
MKWEYVFLTYTNLWRSGSPLINYDALIATWQAAINRDPEDWRYREELAEVYERKMEYAAVVILWKEAVHLRPHEISAHGKLADQAYRLNGDFEEAISTWKIAIQEGADEKHIFLGLVDAVTKR